jgi:hypothetical protein
MRSNRFENLDSATYLFLKVVSDSPPASVSTFTTNLINWDDERASDLLAKLIEFFENFVAKLEALGLIVVNSSTISLTDKGRLFIETIETPVSEEDFAESHDIVLYSLERDDPPVRFAASSLGRLAQAFESDEPGIVARTESTPPLPSPALAQSVAQKTSEHPRSGWLIENIPRRMRVHVPVEAEIRISPTLAALLTSELAGEGEPFQRPVDISEVMALRLSAPKGGFVIEAQTPEEAQWVLAEEPGWEQDFAAWRFTITPTRRGKNVLRVTLSHKRAGHYGLMAGSLVPDETIDVIVTINYAKASVGTLAWSLSMLASAALGAYFMQIVEWFKPLTH